MFEHPSVPHPSHVSGASSGKEEGQGVGLGLGEEEGEENEDDDDEEEDLGFFNPADSDSDSEVCPHQIITRFQAIVFSLIFLFPGAPPAPSGTGCGRGQVGGARGRDQMGQR